VRPFIFSWNLISTRLSARSMAVGLAALIVSGCVSNIIPIGEWGHPADLDLNSKSLAGIQVAVRCGIQDKAGVVHERRVRICRRLESALKAIGATIQDIDDGQYDDQIHPADLTLWYIDTKAEGVRYSWISLIGTVMTGGIFPLIWSKQSEAELRVSDARGVVLETAPLQMEEVKVGGWGALVAMLIRSGSSDEQNIKAGHLFYRYAQNRVYSQSKRLKFAQASHEREGK
jgi:hypothetical protein